MATIDASNLKSVSYCAPCVSPPLPLSHDPQA